MIMRILATIGTICAGGAIILVIVAIVAAVKETLREKKERKYICALADCECVHTLLRRQSRSYNKSKIGSRRRKRRRYGKRQQDSKPTKLKYERTAEKYRKGSRKYVYAECEHNQQPGAKPGRNSTTDKNSHKTNDSSYSKGVEHGKENYVHERYGRICLL